MMIQQWNGEYIEVPNQAIERERLEAFRERCYRLVMTEGRTPEYYRVQREYLEAFLDYLRASEAPAPRG